MTNLHLIEDEEDTRPCRCDNCGWEGPANETLPACDIMQRIEPGGIVPIGECPECQALCYRTYAELTADNSDLLEICNMWQLVDEAANMLTGCPDDDMAAATAESLTVLAMKMRTMIAKATHSAS